MTTEFIDAYITCALWSSVDDDGEPLDDTHDRSDLTPEALAQMAEDCQQFQADNAELLAQVGTIKRHGHDFWLTRNRHGAGFWDRGYGEIGRKLTDAAHAWGSSDIYIGDDGKLYIS